NVFQLGWPEFFKRRCDRIANLPLHVHRDANPARPSQRLNARGDVHSVAVDIAAAMYHIADVNADFQFNPAIRWDISVTLGEHALDFNGALSSFQRAVELDQKRVANRFDLNPVEAREDFAQELSMFLQQLERELVVALRC